MKGESSGGKRELMAASHDERWGLRGRESGNADVIDGCRGSDRY